MTLRCGRKSDGMEKSKNLCRTAREQNALINTSATISSLLRRRQTERIAHARDDAHRSTLTRAPLISNRPKLSQSVPRGEAWKSRFFRRACPTAVGRRARYASGPMNQSDPADRATHALASAIRRIGNPRQQGVISTEFLQMARERVILLAFLSFDVCAKALARQRLGGLG